MKRTLLALGCIPFWLAGTAQISTYVLQPAALEGPLTFTWAETWGSTPDLNDPANARVGFAAFVDDGTAEDSLGCNALVNGADIVGKIAVVYRGTCEFGTKALNAQNAGALAVVVINNQGSPLAMGPGADGPSVTIPVVMISTDAGTSLRDAILAGIVELRIGSVSGVFEYNLNTSAKLVSIPQYSALPSGLAADINFQINIGSWVKNFGSLAQSDATLSCVITQDGVEVYNNTSVPGLIAPGDSLFFGLEVFSQPSYNGFYEGTYTVSSSNADQFASDNLYTFTFYAGDLFAYGLIDETSLLPLPEQHVRATLDAVDFMACSYFSHPNASAYSIEGIYASATRAAGESMENQFLEARVYEWLDDFTGWSDAATANIVQQVSGEYVYQTDLSAQTVYVPLQETFQLEDDIRYLFCIFSPAPDVFLGFGEALDYDRLQTELDEPIYLINDDGAWGSFSDATHTSIGAKLTPTVGISEVERVQMTPYPNPTSNMLIVRMNGQQGAAWLRVFDLAGKQVLESKIGVGGDQLLNVDVSSLASGTYLFHMEFDNGKRSDFRVVVTK